MELCSEDVGPNVTGTETETEGNTVLAFLEFVDEFDSRRPRFLRCGKT
jgi:hypothetical protein